MKLGFAVQIPLALRCEKSETVPSAAYIEKGGLFPSSPERERLPEMQSRSKRAAQAAGKRQAISLEMHITA